MMANIVVIPMTDQNQRIAFLGKLHGLDVDLGHQGASCIDHAQPAPGAVLAHFGGDSVRAINNPLAVGHLVFAIDEHRSLAAQFLHDKAVVDDFLADIDRRPKRLERDAHHIDGADHARAESTRFQQQQGLSVTFR